VNIKRVVEVSNTIITDHRGELVISEFDRQFDFLIKRHYVLKGCSREYPRGGHAHIDLWQYFVCLVGSVEIVLFDGHVEHQHKLSSASQGLLVGPMIWRDLHNFSDDAVVSVLASETYSERDYIRDKAKFEILVKG
jgi:dTDP-4-dehydrorhamnose 3,5-epimerase-like enzyme